MEEGLELLEPTELYNMLQQATIFSNLTDPNYMLLMGRPIDNLIIRNIIIILVLWTLMLKTGKCQKLIEHGIM